MPPPARLKYQTSAPLELTPPPPASPITSLNISRVYKQENLFLLPLNLSILRLQPLNIYTNTYVCKM